MVASPAQRVPKCTRWSADDAVHHEPATGPGSGEARPPRGHTSTRSRFRTQRPATERERAPSLPTELLADAGRVDGDDHLRASQCSAHAVLEEGLSDLGGRCGHWRGCDLAGASCGPSGLLSKQAGPPGVWHLCAIDRGRVGLVLVFFHRARLVSQPTPAFRVLVGGWVALACGCHFGWPRGGSEVNYYGGGPGGAIWFAAH